ncbi:MAG: heavy metal translocating P-type ATPase metal-binding domain-containing protein [Verrucomicrobiota bacterium]
MEPTTITSNESERVMPREATVQKDGSPDNSAARLCFHCGSPNPNRGFRLAGHDFCCQGCLTVFELLTANGLEDYYRLNQAAGVRVVTRPAPGQFEYLDAPIVRERVVHFSDARITRVLFRIPSIHCIACVWLLENLFRLQPGIGVSQVHFPRKEVAITFETPRLKLSELVALLASLGYEPELKLSDLEQRVETRVYRRLWLQLGVAGFAFGNIMLLSLSSYLGLDSTHAPGFQKLMGLLSFLLALPVVFYSASDYWRAAWNGLKQRLLTIEVPIAAGIVAIFLQSSYEVATGQGEGYFDSLAGLLFFLLSGKLFQQKTFDRLAFDRDYKSFFPLSVTRRRDAAEERVALAQLEIGDRVVLRHGELIPADARHLAGAALIDYSFVTGESDPVQKQPGDALFAGGRQIGGAIEVEVTKAVSQSYLASLWNQAAFQKSRKVSLQSLTNRYSERFTKIILGIALASALFWAWANPAKSLKSFTAVLIVACPCALALAAPFALGTAQRVLSRRGVFLKNAEIIESLARIDTVVFDKTGTLTTNRSGTVRFCGEELSDAEKRIARLVLCQSTHPHAVRIAEFLEQTDEVDGSGLSEFREVPGFGITAMVAEHSVALGSSSWLANQKIPLPQDALAATSDSSDAGGLLRGASQVHLAMDGQYCGFFSVESSIRSETRALVQNLSPRYQLAMLSGDNQRERARFTEIFGSQAALHFNQSPLDKLQFIQARQQRGQLVLMVGDGLNDAGALKQSDVGVAVVEQLSAFSPASDVILEGAQVANLAQVLRFSERTVRVVQTSFIISALYNVIGISIAARGLLSPVVCAILMPLSSVSVVAFACLAVVWAGRRLDPAPPKMISFRRAVTESKTSASGPTVLCEPVL